MPEKATTKGNSEHSEDTEPRTWIENQGKKWAPAFRILILGIICVIAVLSRVFSVIRYESVIHEFDPWFNFRATKILSEQGFYPFKYWIDQEAWYPLGRYSGHTLFPGLMMTAWIMHKIANNILMFPLDIREVCVFTAPVFSAFTAIVTYLLTVEITKKTERGLFSALFMAIIPSYMSRSVAGSYDNEAVAIFALVFAFYTFVRALNRGSLFTGLVAALGFYYMVLTWGGYVFVLGLISLYVVGLMLVEKFNAKVYIAFSIFYVIGNLLSLTMPFVSIWAVWESTEHLPSHVAFIFMNFYMLTQFVRNNLSKEKFDFLTKAVIRIGIFLVVAGFLYILVMGKTTAGHRILTLINPVYAKKHNPLVASISEHQPTAWSSYFFDLHYTLLFAPIGIYVALRQPNQAKLFIAAYGLLAVYFASVMIRLLLAAAPATCILSGMGVSFVVSQICDSIRHNLSWFFSLFSRSKDDDGDEDGAKRKKAKQAQKNVSKIPLEFGVIGLLFIAYLVCKTIFHGTWSGAEAYSHPSIIMSYSDQSGRRHIIDDYREAYYWLRRNTKEEARVMSWWDYGYQIAGMGNRTTIVDNNTWNKTHIGRVGMAMGSREEEAHEIATSMDVDYVLVIFGGVSGYSGDDINKFLWMVRIGGSENPHIKESDYFGGGQYRVDSGGSPTMLNCLMYKLCYYRFAEIDQGRGRGYDVQRQAVIGNPDITLNYFEEAFTSKNWIVRIYRVKKKGNRDGIMFESEKKELSVQELSGLDSFKVEEKAEISIHHKYKYKLFRMSTNKFDSLKTLKDSYYYELVRTSGNLGFSKFRNLSSLQNDVVRLGVVDGGGEGVVEPRSNPFGCIKGYDLFSVDGDAGFDYQSVRKLSDNVLEVIRKVEIVNNKLKMIPGELQYFTRIKRLRLNNNKIRSLTKPSQFLTLNLPSLEFLDLTDNHLTEIPKTFFKSAQKLQRLFLTRNKIEEIPPEIDQLGALRVLHINANAFHSLPLSITNLKLTEFNLDWFEYLEPPVIMPLRGADVYARFCSKVQGMGLDVITLQGFPRIVTGAFKYRIKSGETNSLCRAAYRADLAMIEHIVSEQKDLLDSRNGKDYNPYNIALRTGRLKSFGVLCNMRSRFDHYSESFGSSLLLSIPIGNEKVVEMLIKDGVDPNICDSLGNNALHYTFGKLQEPNIDKYHRITELLLSRGVDMNWYNKAGETPLILAIKRKLQYPFLIAEAWNGDKVDIGNSMHNDLRQRFDLALVDKSNGKSCLHYIAETLYLGLTTLVLAQAPDSSIVVDDRLRVPVDYKECQYLVSKKILMRYYRQRFREEIKAKKCYKVEKRKEEKLASKGLLCQKVDRLKALKIKNIKTIKKHHREKKQHPTRSSISSVPSLNIDPSKSPFQKSKKEFEFYSRFSSLRQPIVLTRLKIKNLVKVMMIDRLRRHSLVKEGVRGLKYVLVLPKIHEIWRDLWGQLGQLRRLKSVINGDRGCPQSTKSKYLMIVDSLLCSEFFKNLNIFFGFLSSNGTALHLKLSINLLDHLYNNAFYHLNRVQDRQNSKNRKKVKIDKSDQEKLGREFYFDELTLLYSKEKFYCLEEALILKIGNYDQLKHLGS